jgi:hypothetical protein
MWGFAKKILRRMPFERRKELGSFINEVKASIAAVDPIRMRRFRRRCRKYMLVYDAIVSCYALEKGIKKTSEEAMTAATSYNAIEKLVKDFGQNNKRRQEPRKKRSAPKSKELFVQEDDICAEELKAILILSKRRDGRPTPKKNCSE